MKLYSHLMALNRLLINLDWAVLCVLIFKHKIIYNIGYLSIKIGLNINLTSIVLSPKKKILFNISKYLKLSLTFLHQRFQLY